MKFKVKFRVINEAGKDQKFSINLEDEKVFVLGKSVPGIKHAVGILQAACLPDRRRIRERQPGKQCQTPLTASRFQV